jgi:L-cystine uptake protein TcyP (sodium:dicarboxylate symporter family)
MEHEEIEEKNRPRFAALFLLVGMLIGFLLGFLLHDFLVEHSPLPNDIKSWYPR